MIIIIPIGGIGQRFKDNGYTKPKALINIFGKSIISYLLESLNIVEIDYIYIPYNKEYKQYNLEKFLKKQYPHISFNFYCLEKNTRGAAETINIALNNLNEPRNIPIICLDCDSFYHCDIISQWNGENNIFTFEDRNENPIYSYLKKNDYNEILDIKEKEKISNNACSGAYGFKSINELKKYTLKIIEGNIKQKSEFYISGVIKEMINDGIVFINILIEKKNFVQLGIPNDVEKFKTDIIIKNIKLPERITLDVRGHSNYNINIINIQNINYLCKSSNNYVDSIRLNKQIEKQIYHCKLFNLNTPDIIFKSNSCDETVFLMGYLNKSKMFLIVIDSNYWY